MDSSVIYSLGLGMQVNIKRTDGENRILYPFGSCVSMDGWLKERREKKGRF